MRQNSTLNRSQQGQRQLQQYKRLQERLRLHHRWVYGPVYQDLPLALQQASSWTDDNAEREKRLSQHLRDPGAASLPISIAYAIGHRYDNHYAHTRFFLKEVSKLSGIGERRAWTALFTWNHCSSKGILLGECFKNEPSEKVYAMLNANAGYGRNLTRSAFRELKQWWLEGQTKTPIDVSEFANKIHCPCCSEKFWLEEE